jgi:hypothetical protein
LLERVGDEDLDVIECAIRIMADAVSDADQEDSR